MKPTTPWLALAMTVLGAFIVWLSIQMTRTDRADRIVLILAGCFVLIGVAFALATVRLPRRRSRER